MWGLNNNNSRYQHTLFNESKVLDLDGLLIVVGEIIRRPTLIKTESGPLTILINPDYVKSSLLTSEFSQTVILQDSKYAVLSSLSVF